VHAAEGNADVRDDDKEDGHQRTHVLEGSAQRCVQAQQRQQQHGLALPLPATNAVRIIL